MLFNKRQGVSPNSEHLLAASFCRGPGKTETHEKYVKPLYSLFEEALEEDESGNSKKMPDIKPLIMSSTNDMSTTWKMIGKGGTAKVKEFFGHCCICVSSEKNHHNETQCQFCANFVEERHTLQDDWKCYHRQTINSQCKEDTNRDHSHLLSKLTV